MIERDICIIGAGPGGAAAALQLAYQGVGCVLVEKETFPRDKICGDALSGKVSTVLNRMDPAIMDRLRASQKQADMWGLRLSVPEMEALELELDKTQAPQGIAPGYVIKRFDFDHFLISEIRRHACIQLVEGILMDPKHHAGGVRAYYKNVGGIHE